MTLKSSVKHGATRVEGQRNEVFSLLRFLFVIVIVGYHFAPAKMKEVVTVFNHGQVVVTFFFVLSGYMTHLSSRQCWRGTGDFLFRKLKSLGPLYLTVAVVSLAIELKNGRTQWAAIVLHFSGVQAWVPGLQLALNPPAWFMSALMAMLLLYPMLRRLSRSGVASQVVAWFYWFVVQWATVYFDVRGIEPSSNYWLYFPPFHLASFLLGTAAAEWTASNPEAIAKASVGLNFLHALAALGVLCLALLTLKWMPASLHQAARTSLCAPLFVFLITSMASLPEIALRWFDRPWVRLLGALAFPIYLLQVPMLMTFESLVLNGHSEAMTTAFYILYLACLIVVAGLWLLLGPVVYKRWIH